MTLIDLTAPVADRMPVFPGDPEYKREWHVYFGEHAVCCTKLSFGPHTGTHVDAPLHFIEGGISIDQMPLGRFFGEGVCVDCRGLAGLEVGPQALPELDTLADKVVLFLTGWQQRAGTPEFFEPRWPGLSGKAARLLAEAGVKAVGIDSPSIDSMAGLGAGAPAHAALLRAGLPIFESLINLDKIISTTFIFHGYPLRLEGCEASPVRAVALLP